MKVTLTTYTPEEVIAIAAGIPYNTPNPTTKLAKRVFDYGHRSIYRHGSAAFLVEDVSVSLLAQISRHPHINLTVESTRYNDMTERGYYTPEDKLEKMNKLNSNKEIGDIEDFLKEYENDMKDILNIYVKWKQFEINMGDKGKEFDLAKLFLPKAIYCTLMVSGSYQALFEFMGLRNCVRAESEINRLSKEMGRLLGEKVSIFKDVDCYAKTTGVCTEINPCGKYLPKKNK